MKTNILKILFFNSFIFLFCGLIYAQFGGGTGTETDPYRIYTKADLEELSDSIIANISFEGKHFKLMNNINEPLTYAIGTGPESAMGFQGYFHGSGNYISMNLEYNYSNYNCLFRYLGEHAIIDSVTLEGFMDRCFGLVYDNDGTISNCINNVETSNLLFEEFDSWRGQNGFCYYNSGIILNCTNNANFFNSAAISGISGSNSGIISNCINNGIFTGSNLTYSIAGISSENINSGIIINCTNTSDITSNELYEEVAWCGGICSSQINNSRIINCQNLGNIYTKVFTFSGGITGVFENGKILNCSNYGNITGNHNIGGIVGGYTAPYGNSSNPTDTIGTIISNCFNSGTISADSLAYGIRGDMHINDTISNCLNIGNVLGSAILDTSSNETTFIYNNFYDKQMIPHSFGIGFNDVEGQAEGKLSTQLVGNSPELQAMLGDGWSYAEGRYPIPLGLENDSMALVAATPVYLDFENDSVYNHVDSVTKNFTVGLENNVTWEEANGRVSFNNENATLLSIGTEKLTASLGNYSKEVRINILDIEPINIQENIAEKGISIYPNPANDFININLNETNADKMELCDITGKIISTSDLNSKQTTISTENLHSGLYLLKLYNKNQNIASLSFMKK